MSGRVAAGPPTFVVAGRLTSFLHLSEFEIAALAAALEISVAELGQRGLEDGRSAIRAFEMLVDGDVERRIASATAPTAREVAAVLGDRAGRIGAIIEELGLMLGDVSRSLGSASSAEAEAARRLIVAGLPLPMVMLGRVAMATAAQALALNDGTGADQWSPCAIDDAGFVSLAELLDEIGFSTEIGQDSETDHRPGVFQATAVVLATAVLDRLETAGLQSIPGAGIAGSRVRQFLELRPVTIARRLRRARERNLVAELADPSDAFRV